MVGILARYKDRKYPLVNSHITMENHYFSWVIFSMAIFYVAFCMFTRPGIPFTSERTFKSWTWRGNWLRVYHCNARFRGPKVIPNTHCTTGWWLTYASEKYESQWEGLSHILWKMKNVWNQPDKNGLGDARSLLWFPAHVALRSSS
jgi:hypothetical protein